MATISNINLSIGAGSSSTRRTVTVTYTVCFSSCEALDNTVFIEKVTLRGDDPVWDDHLTTIKNECIRAQNGCVDRRIVQDVARSTLDEDPDTIIFGWVLGNRDEVYAKVELIPFVPSGASGTSGNVTGHFGPAGA